MRTYSQKWQRPQAGEWQGLKSRFKTNSSRDTAREMTEGKKTRAGADRMPFDGRVRGQWGQGRREGGGSASALGRLDAPLHTGRLDAPLSRHELHLPGTLVRLDVKASAEPSRSSLGREFRDEMALPARKTRGSPAPLTTSTHSFVLFG